MIDLGNRRGPNIESLDHRDMEAWRDPSRQGRILRIILCRATCRRWSDEKRPELLKTPVGKVMAAVLWTELINVLTKQWYIDTNNSDQ